MPDVERKTEIAPLNATPEKRSFWSIISDYDLKTGICELIDNAIDIWTVSKRSTKLLINVELDLDRQLLMITDNAGGVKHEDLRVLVTPGGSKNSPDGSTIGIFGVGSKRAVIALGESVSLKTHHRDDQSYQIDLSREWMESPSWDLAAYQIPNIEPGTTKVELSALRRIFLEQDVQLLRTHFAEIYSYFLANGCTIIVNGEPIAAACFNSWAFPPNYQPQQATFVISPDRHHNLNVTITAGLIRDRIAEADNYGVYFYCNDRLIVKELKARDVGYYVSTEAGVPHPDASLCRVIVELKGPANLMPWTSNKTNINTDHPTFSDIRPTIIQLITQFTKLSRAFKGDWDESVFRYKTGKIVKVDNKEVTSRGKLILPPTPRVNKSHAELLKAKNRKRIDSQPWTLGLVEAMAAVDIIIRQRLETKNRIALLLLDSNFEIALKEYIVHNPTLFPSVNLKALFEDRSKVIKEISNKVKMESSLVGKASHYYNMRNKFIHERATVDIPDSDIENYSKTIKRFLKLLFDLKFE
jgi:hypothetical protein